MNPVVKAVSTMHLCLEYREFEETFHKRRSEIFVLAAECVFVAA